MPKRGLLQLKRQQKIVEEAKQEASAIKREKHLEAKEEAHRLRNEIERESRDRRNELQRFERRLMQKEESLDRKANSMERKEEELRRKEEENRRFQEKLEQLYKQQITELERISNMSMDEAKDTILQRARDEISHEMAMMINEVESQARDEAAKGPARSLHWLFSAVQRITLQRLRFQWYLCPMTK